MAGSGLACACLCGGWTGWGDGLAAAREMGGDPGLQDAQNAAMQQKATLGVRAGVAGLYYVIVDGVGGASGAVTLNVQ